MTAPRRQAALHLAHLSTRSAGSARARRHPRPRRSRSGTALRRLRDLGHGPRPVAAAAERARPPVAPTADELDGLSCRPPASSTCRGRSCTWCRPSVRRGRRRGRGSSAGTGSPGGSTTRAHPTEMPVDPAACARLPRLRRSPSPTHPHRRGAPAARGRAFQATAVIHPTTPTASARSCATGSTCCTSPATAAGRRPRPSRRSCCSPTFSDARRARLRGTPTASCAGPARLGVSGRRRRSARSSSSTRATSAASRPAGGRSAGSPRRSSAAAPAPSSAARGRSATTPPRPSCGPSTGELLGGASTG